MKPIPTQGLSLDSIQAMRAIAAVSVVLAHLPLVGVGVFGVDIFFVISGFIVAYVTRGSADGFLRKRIARVVPLYWAGTLAVFGVAMAAPALLNSTTADLGNLVKSLFFVPYMKENGTVMPVLFLGWTLNYEMFFYVLYALALRLDHQRAPLLAMIAILALVVGGQVLAPAGVIPAFYTAPVLLEFACGLAAFLLWRHRQAWLARVPMPVAFAAALATLALMGTIDSGTINTTNRWLLMGLPALVFFLAVLSLQGKARMPALLVLTGDASYSLYLFHPYLVQLIDRKVIALGAPTPLVVAVSAGLVALCIFLALMCFRWFERPSNQWLRRKLRA